MDRLPSRTAATRRPLAVAAARRPFPAVATTVLALVLTLLPGARAADAAPDAGAEAQFVALINAERASAGLPEVRVAGDLVEVGRRHARRMADQQHLHHNPALGSDVTGWDKVGENVGRGPDVDRVHAAFMASDAHRRNILDAEWIEVGVGVEVTDGGIWVTELFRLPTGAAAPASQPQAEAEPAPAPADAAPRDEERADEPPAPEPAAPEPAAATADAPPEPREIVTVPLPVDRVMLVLARLGVDDDGRPGIDDLA